MPDQVWASAAVMQKLDLSDNALCSLSSSHLTACTALQVQCLSLHSHACMYSLLLREYLQCCKPAFRVTGRHNGDCLKGASHAPLRIRLKCTGAVTLPNHTQMIRAELCWQDHVRVLYAHLNLKQRYFHRVAIASSPTSFSHAAEPVDQNCDVTVQDKPYWLISSLR